MKRHLATALLIGAGLLPESAVSAADRSWNSGPSLVQQRIAIDSILRRPIFDHLASAGRFKRADVATFCCEDGRLWAEWSGNVCAPEPRRLETMDLDAEWMAHAPATIRPAADHWMLARRDLHPAADGRFWTVHCYGGADPAVIQLRATLDGTRPADTPILSATYTQNLDVVRLSIATHSCARRNGSVELSAPDLPHLLASHPAVLRSCFAPALQRIAGIELQ